MDYFSVPSTTKGAGLINPYVKLDYAINIRSEFSFGYHMFFLRNKYLPDNINQSINRFLGHELDLSYSNNFYDYLNLTVGYSVFFGSNSMELLSGGNKSGFNNWAFVMLTVNPTLFRHKNE